jgi:hypothetical protein
MPTSVVLTGASCCHVTAVCCACLPAKLPSSPAVCQTPSRRLQLRDCKGAGHHVGAHCLSQSEHAVAGWQLLACAWSGAHLLVAVSPGTGGCWRVCGLKLTCLFARCSQVSVAAVLLLSLFLVSPRTVPFPHVCINTLHKATSWVVQRADDYRGNTLAGTR